MIISNTIVPSNEMNKKNIIEAVKMSNIEFYEEADSLAIGI